MNERATRLLLLASVFVIATCGLIYELVAGTLASYLLGDSVTQFSTVIGVYLFAMGVGSWLSGFVRRNEARLFVHVQLMVGLAGGGSAAEPAPGACARTRIGGPCRRAADLHGDASCSSAVGGPQVPSAERRRQEHRTHGVDHAVSGLDVLHGDGVAVDEPVPGVVLGD